MSMFTTFAIKNYSNLEHGMLEQDQTDKSHVQSTTFTKFIGPLLWIELGANDRPCQMGSVFQYHISMYIDWSYEECT